MDVFGFFEVYRASCSLRLMGQLIKVLSLSLAVSLWVAYKLQKSRVMFHRYLRNGTQKVNLQFTWSL